MAQSNAEVAWGGLLNLVDRATWDRQGLVEEKRNGPQNAVIGLKMPSSAERGDILGDAKAGPEANTDSNRYMEMLMNMAIGPNTLGGVRSLMERQIFDWNPADVKEAGLHDSLVKMFDEREQSARQNLTLSMMSGYLSGNFMVDPTVMAEVTSSKMMKDKLVFERDLLMNGTPKQQKAAAQFIGDMYLGANYPQEKLQAFGSLAAMSQAEATNTAMRMNGVQALAELTGKGGLTTQDQIQLLNATGNYLGALRNIKGDEKAQKPFLDKLDEMVNAIRGYEMVPGAYRRSEQNLIKPGDN